MRYDLLVVGAGLYGATFAHLAKKVGKRVLVIDKRDHVAGNCHTVQFQDTSTYIHKYGPHIFHTNSSEIWKFVNQFAEFNHYRPGTKARIGDKIYSFPLNLMTFHQVWSEVNSPESLQHKLKSLCWDGFSENYRNMEEWLLGSVGEQIYKMFFYGYTTKQWGVPPKELPASIVKRLPFRTTFDDCYFTDKYVGVPVDGYTKMVKKMLYGIDVELKTPFDHVMMGKFPKILFTGSVDGLLGYAEGFLPYRSLNFVEKVLPEVDDYQGCAAMHYPSLDVPFTRIIEHKHYTFGTHRGTVITEEHPFEWSPGKERFYPKVGEVEKRMYNAMKALVGIEYPHVLLGGRLGEYRYYDMHQAIGGAMTKFNRWMNAAN